MNETPIRQPPDPGKYLHNKLDAASHRDGNTGSIVFSIFQEMGLIPAPCKVHSRRRFR